MPFKLKPIRVDGGSGFVLVPGSKLSPAESDKLNSVPESGGRSDKDQWPQAVLLTLAVPSVRRTPTCAGERAILLREDRAL
jgi:hypothetical protein